MPFYTPLRYPGGKRRLAPAVTRLLQANRLTDVQYAEPYAGGAAIALALVFEGYAADAHINDLSRPVYAFWHSVLHDNAALCRRIEGVRISMREWHRQRAVYEERERADLLDLGFAALFLNRTNRSGIIGGGVIGGQGQQGAWGLDARFNKGGLIQRIQKIGRYSNRIHLYQLDALEFTRTIVPTLGSKSFTFYDPPYIEKGPSLYLDEYDLRGHRELSARVASLRQPWVVTYDYAAIGVGLYTRHRRLVYGLNYSTQERYQGREVMFLAPRLALPDDWRPRRDIQLARPGSPYPLLGRMENVRTRRSPLDG